MDEYLYHVPQSIDSSKDLAGDRSLEQEVEMKEKECCTCAS